MKAYDRKSGTDGRPVVGNAHHILGSVLGVLFAALPGCSSLPDHSLGESLKKEQDKVAVKLESKGRLFAAQAYRSTAKANCSQLRSALGVSVQGESGTAPVSMVFSCDFMKNHVALVSKSVLRPGSYTVRVIRGNGAKFLVDRPVISVRYEDPDFNSGTDFIAQGAKELAAGQILKGSVGSAGGNRTDWVRVSGKQTAVSLTLVSDQKNKGLVAQVFDLAKGPSQPNLLGNLVHKKTRSFPLVSNNIYVRLKSEGYGGEGSYSLIRGEFAGSAAAMVKASANLPVIDLYQVAEGESVVLLGAGDGLKSGDAVAVFGRIPGGEMRQLGDCEITTVQSGQASCLLRGGDSGGQYTDLRATKKAGAS